MAIQSATKKTMNEYLNNIYYIPMNQRDYTWETDQLEDFWQDLLSVKNNQGRQHFFGQIVVYEDNKNNEKKKYIIDGQQRTVTSMIFLRAIQYLSGELVRETDVADEKKGLESLNHSLEEPLGRTDNCYDSSSHLHLTFESEISENDFYSKHIIAEAPSFVKMKDQPACENMRIAYCYFVKKLKSEIDTFIMDEKIRTLYDFRNALLKNFEVMYLETNDLGESYVIFETLNARGKDLETADLLKNYVFSQAREKLYDVQSKWRKMTDSLSGLDLTKYIRYYWNAKYGLVRERDLYREISVRIKNSKDSYDLVTELEDNAEYYHDACMPDSCDAYDDKDITDRLLAIHTLHATSFIPILLSLELRKGNFTDKDKAKILRAIEVYIFRNATIAGKTANSTEVFFSKIAHDIYEEKLIKANKIIEEIKKEMIPDKDFYNSFCTFSKKTQPYIRYILLSIHSFLDSNHEINRNSQQVNIEHIMPKHISKKAWPDINPAIHDKYLWRLGNLILLDDSINKKISNKSFKDKKTEYRKSLIKPNSELLKYDEWAPKQIENRQRELADIALKIWN